MLVHAPRIVTVQMLERVILGKGREQKRGFDSFTLCVKHLA